MARFTALFAAIFALVPLDPCTGRAQTYPEALRPYFEDGADFTSVPKRGQPGWEYFSNGADVMSHPLSQWLGVPVMQSLVPPPPPAPAPAPAEEPSPEPATEELAAEEEATDDEAAAEEEAAADEAAAEEAEDETTAVEAEAAGPTEPPSSGTTTTTTPTTEAPAVPTAAAAPAASTTAAPSIRVATLERVADVADDDRGVVRSVFAAVSKYALAAAIALAGLALLAAGVVLAIRASDRRHHTP